MGDAAEPPPAEDVPVATVPFEQMPIDELPQPEPVTVTLVDVEADVWWAWDADGSVWLLPAYRLIDTDGGWHVVPAVTDEFMIQVEPSIVDGPLPAPEPMPVDPMPAETDPVTAPEPGSASPAVRPVEIIDVVRQVQYYPGCQNEPVTIDGTTWYPLAEFEFGDLVTEIVAIPRQDPADASTDSLHVSLRPVPATTPARWSSMPTASPGTVRQRRRRLDDARRADLQLGLLTRPTRSSRPRLPHPNRCG